MNIVRIIQICEDGKHKLVTIRLEENDFGITIPYSIFDCKECLYKNIGIGQELPMITKGDVKYHVIYGLIMNHDDSCTVPINKYRSKDEYRGTLYVVKYKLDNLVDCDDQDIVELIKSTTCTQKLIGYVYSFIGW
jgi:hypothetical protein